MASYLKHCRPQVLILTVKSQASYFLSVFKLSHSRILLVALGSQGWAPQVHLSVHQSWFDLTGRVDLLSTWLMLLPSETESAKSDLCITTQGYCVIWWSISKFPSRNVWGYGGVVALRLKYPACALKNDCAYSGYFFVLCWLLWSIWSPYFCCLLLVIPLYSPPPPLMGKK